MGQRERRSNRKGKVSKKAYIINVRFQGNTK